MARVQRQPREGGDPVLGDEPGVRNGEPAPRGARAPSSCANTAAPTYPATKDKRPSSELGLSRMWPWLIHAASSESLWPLTPRSSPSNSFQLLKTKALRLSPASGPLHTCPLPIQVCR